MYLKATLYLFLIILFSACNNAVESTKPKLTQMTESVYASVTIQPDNFYTPYAARPGIIQKIYVEEGDAVSNGQLLMKVTASNQQILTDNAALSVEKARENYLGKTTLLDNISNDITLVRKQIELDSLNFERQKRLWENSIGSKSQLENLKLKFDLAKGQLDALKKRYKQTELDLKNAYERSKNLLAKEQTTGKDYAIYSKIDGKVYTIFKEEGELIGTQEPFAQLASQDSFTIEMDIDEVDIVRIKTGDRVLVNLDAYEEQIFEARITKIFPLKDDRTQTFKVECAFVKAPSVLYAGLSGEANIVIAEKENVLTIPATYLTEGNQVITKEGTVEVKVGLKSFEVVEILSGIDTSTVIQKPQ